MAARKVCWVGACATTLTLFAFPAASVHAEEAGRTVNIAEIGSSLLNSDLTMGASMGGTTVNDAGQVLFLSRVQGTDNSNDNAYFIGSSEGLNLVALRHQELPNGGTLASFRGAVLNNAGDVAFAAAINDSGSDYRGIFVGSGDGLTQYARVDQELAAGDGGGSLTGGAMGNLQFNDAGRAIFTAGISHDGDGRRGIFSTSGAGLTELVREYQDISGTDGRPFWQTVASRPGPDFSSNNIGQAVFNAEVDAPAGVLNYFATFISNNGNVSLLSSSNDPLHIGNGERLHTITDTSINDDGVITFRGTIRNQDGNAIDNSLGYFRYDQGQITELVRQGDTVPDGDGTFNNLTTGNTLKHNDVGQMAFRSTVTDGPDGIFRASSDGVVQIARIGDALTDDATLSSLLSSAMIDINDSGTVAYRAVVTVGSQNRNAIYLSDGIDTVQAVRRGVPAGDTSIFSLVTTQEAGLNKHGQVAYRANGTGSAANQIVNLFTPDLHYRVSDDGSFDDGMNWTLSLTPGNPHDVFLASDSNVTVTADAGERNVNSLEIGGGAGQAALHLVQNSTINVAEQVTVKAGGTLGGEGSITGDVVNLSGFVSPGSSPGILSVTGDYTQDEDGTLLIEIGGLNAGIDYDVLDIGGDAVLGGELVLRFIDGFAPTQDDEFDFMQVFGDTFENFELVTIENLEDDFEYDIVGVGTLVALNDGTFIPEPGTLALLSMGGLMLVRRRSRG
ncbi:choice-of-anchor tandem repeat NxxGxxAF-containing protein [Phycisphaerales bacterium AB-hyl4]|uniref:Choice-of-anchor tandem repeat NxxGxxAF-containing protein n=1 Tax=Natronomicrosphaera hydrolytica TaxID=3242702 RepID=A0ABV4UBW6_9BACT